jgi:fibronectin-binding autotransporter adhesin
MKSLLRNVAVVAIVLAACGTAHAQKSWNVASGNWNTAGNWSPSGVPASGNAVAISNDGTATLNVASSGLTSLTIGTSSSVLQKDNSTNGYTITLNNTAGNGLVTNSGTIRYGQGSTGEFRITSGPLGVNNSGLITADVAASELRLTMSNAVGVDLVNSGTLRADAGLLRLSGSSFFDLPNTGGVLSAINGGTINFSSGGRVTGGTVSVAAGSTLLHSRTNDGTDLTDVTVSNAGRMFTESPSNTSYRIKFLGSTALTNSGTLEFLTSGTSAAIVFGEAASTATITNQATGIIRVANNNTAGAATAYFLNSTGTFTNQGSIEIKSNALLTTGASSQFRSTTVDFTNAGSFLVDGPVSSIAMTGRTFTQSAGSLSLINGGSMVATSVLINGGTLLGTGTINAPVTVGGSVAPGNAGIGTLSVTNGVTWNAGNAWLFELGASGLDMNNPGTSDLLSLTGTFTKGTGSTFTFDFANSGTDGWYKLVDYASTNFTPGTNTSFAATNVPAGKSANFVVDSGSTALYVQIVPEPSTLAFAGLGIGLAGLIASRRRRLG